MIKLSELEYTFSDMNANEASVISSASSHGDYVPLKM